MTAAARALYTGACPNFSSVSPRSRAELDRLRPLAPNGLSNLEHVHDLELTWSSNAIEGNTLTAAETTLVVERGITIGGKPLKDHMEAIDHFEAIHYVRELARQDRRLTEMDVRNFAWAGGEAVQSGYRRPLRRSGPFHSD